MKYSRAPESFHIQSYDEQQPEQSYTRAKAQNIYEHITAHSILRSIKKGPESNFLYTEILTYLTQLIIVFVQEFILFFWIVYSFL